MKKLSEFLIKNLKYITLLYVFVVVILILFFTVRGDDFHFHMMRIHAIADEYRANGFSAFPIRIYSTVLDGYGYACPMFYGDIFLHPFSILTLFGVSVLNGYRLMKASVLTVTYIITKNVSKKLYGNSTYADIFVAIYIISATVYGNATGSAIGRSFAMMFVPLAMAGLYMILYKRFEYDWLVLGTAVAGLLFSNVLDCLICVFALGVIFLFNLRILDKQKFLKLAKAILVFIGLTLWFVLPMIEQMNSQSFFVTSKKISQGKNDLSQYTVPFMGIFVPAKVYKKILYVCNMDSSGIIAYMNDLLVFIFICIVSLKKYKDIKKDYFIKAMLVLLIGFVWFQTRFFPFEKLKFFVGTLQFPYRVRIVMAVMASFICVKLFEISQSKRIIISILLMSVYFICLTCMTTVGAGIARAVLNGEKYMDYSYAMNDIMGAEYLPEKLMRDDYRYDTNILKNHQNKVICTDSEVSADFKRFNNYSQMNFRNNNGKNKFEIPIIIYKGYEATYSDSGEVLSINSSKNGLIEISSDRKSASVEIKYVGTTIQHISEIISLVFCLGLLGYLLLRQYKVRRLKDSLSN